MNWPASQPAMSPRTIQPRTDMCAFLRCLGRVAWGVLEQRSCHWHVACGTLGAMRGVMLILVSVLVAFSAQSAFADDAREHGRAPRGPGDKLRSRTRLAGHAARAPAALTVHPSTT